MVQNEKSKFEAKVDESPELIEMRKMRQEIDSDIYKNVQSLEESVKSGNLDSTKSNLSKLDQGLKNYDQKLKTTIAGLVLGLNGDLTEYTQFAKGMKNYTTIENVVKIFSKRKAADMQTNRIKSLDVKQGLDLVLKNTSYLVQEILEEREVAKSAYNKLELSARVIATTIKEYEPKEASLKLKKDAMEAIYKAKVDESATANAERQAVLALEIDKLHAELVPVRAEYGKISTIYRVAQESLMANNLSRDSFEKMVDDLGIQAQQLKSKMENFTQVYAATPHAVRIMMTTKGMESADKTINATATICLDTITESAAGVSDATLKRQEIPTVEPEFVREMYLRIQEMLNSANVRGDAIRESSRKSQNDRYGLQK